MRNQPTDREIHVIADNFSAHKSKQLVDFLAQHTKVRLHFTLTYSAWLNQFELWFGKIARDVIAWGVFTSMKSLARKLMRDIRHYNDVPKIVLLQNRPHSGSSIILDTFVFAFPVR